MDKNKTLEKILDLGVFAGSCIATYGLIGDQGLDNIGVMYSIYNAYDELKKFTPLHSGEDKPSFKNYFYKTLMTWGAIKVLDHVF
ncbi:hypothetical protein K9L97_01010 [Candidatus Woesearchaeota archaeon]|nr:hypothetical protein [Candidatus Woesearchaeota archaeon]